MEWDSRKLSQVGQYRLNEIIIKYYQNYYKEHPKITYYYPNNVARVLILLFYFIIALLNVGIISKLKPFQIQIYSFRYSRGKGCPRRRSRTRCAIHYRYVQGHADAEEEHTVE